MVVEFLNELQSEYLDKKLKIESEEKELKNKLEENLELIQKLKEEEEKNFNAFSPRNQKSKYKDNIKNLEQEKESIIKELDNFKQQLNEYAIKIDKIAPVIEEARQKFFQVTSIQDYNEKKNSLKNHSKKDSSELRNVYVKNMTGMIHKLDFCSKIVQIDPSRCKIELSAISNGIRETIDDIYKIDVSEGG